MLAFMISFMVNSDFAAYEIKWEGKFNALSSNIKVKQCLVMLIVNC